MPMWLRQSGDELCEARVAEWAVVVECASPDAARVRLAEIDQLVDDLARWRATALYNPDRYALQVVVHETDPRSALAAALDLHADAARRLGLAAWEVVRTEILTVAELERSWELETPYLPVDPKRLWEMSPPFAVRMHDAARALLRAESADDLGGILARFVCGAGGWVIRPGDPVAGALACDISLGAGGPLLAAAEPFSAERLLLEEALPLLVEDAWRVRRWLEGDQAGPKRGVG